MADDSFPKILRIRSQSEFDQLFRRGVTVYDQTLIVTVITNDLDHCRLGIPIARRVGNAPARNRWKRLIRESFRRQKDSLPRGLDLLVRPRKNAPCQMASVSRSLRNLAARAAKKLQSGEPEK